MTFKRLSILFAALLCVLAFSPKAFAQFRSEAFSQNYSNDPDAEDDSEDAVRDSSFTLSFSEFFKGVAGKGTSRMGNTFFASTVIVGGQQMYNRDYWKLPIIYAGIGTGVGLGIKFRNDYKKSLMPTSVNNSVFGANPGLSHNFPMINAPNPIDAKMKVDLASAYNKTLAYTGTPDLKAQKMSNIMFASAAVVYWASLMDGLLNYETTEEHSATKAALLSMLVPGLGQIYNGDFWKIPVYWGLMLGSYHFLEDNGAKYNKYRQMYIDASKGESTPLPAETAKYWRDLYREWRDYSILAIAASYLLQVIDANVFAYMLDFQVSDDLTLNLEPTLIAPDTQYAFNPAGLGLKLGITF